MAFIVPASGDTQDILANDEENQGERPKSPEDHEIKSDYCPGSDTTCA